MRRLLGAGIFFLAIASCAGGTETGNPAVPIQVGLQIRSSDADAVLVSREAGEGAGTTTISEAWFSFGVFSFLREGECGNLAELEVEAGPTLAVADLARPQTRVAIQLEADTYCGLIVPLERRTSELPEGAPEELFDHSIVLTGERSDGVPFTLAHPEQDELELIHTLGPFGVDAAQDTLLLSFDVAVLMAGVNLDQAELSEDGAIRIDWTSNRELLDTFEHNLECSLELYRDANADGVPDPGDPLLAACAEEED